MPHSRLADGDASVSSHVQVPCDLREELGYVLLSNEPPQITLSAPGSRIVRLPYPDNSALPTLALAPCPTAATTAASGTLLTRCGGFATDTEDGDISARISIEQLHACSRAADAASADECVFCSAASLDAGLCPPGRSYMYRYSVLDSDSNVAEVDREVVVEGVEVWVATSAIFRNPRRTAYRMYADYEARLWREAEWPDAVSTRALAAMHVIGALLGGRFLPEDVRVADAAAVWFEGAWVVNVTLAVAITGRHALPWYEVDAYMADLRASVRGNGNGSAGSAASAPVLVSRLPLAWLDGVGSAAGVWDQSVATGGGLGAVRQVDTGSAATQRRSLLQEAGVPLSLYPAVTSVEVRNGCHSDF